MIRRSFLFPKTLTSNPVSCNGENRLSCAEMVADLRDRQHWNKHEKPYLCNLPGCPNPPKKRKFARRDGLERHQRTVRHVVPPT